MSIASASPTRREVLAISVAAYPKLIYYNKLDKGGHFAAWEQPDLLTAELRAAFRPLRSDNG
jgi:pimeloyl-ACP methyl ester carboxylesterase